MIIYNFYDFSFSNFCPNHHLIRFRAPNNQSIGLIEVACPLPFSVANQLMKMTRNQ